jgi:ribosomal protein S27AE
MAVVMSSYNSDKESVHRGQNYRSCPKCGGPLKAVTEEKTVGTAEIPYKTEFVSVNSMKVYKTRFICPICRLKYTDQDLRRIEKHSKDKNK